MILTFLKLFSQIFLAKMRKQLNEVGFNEGMEGQSKKVTLSSIQFSVLICGPVWCVWSCIFVYGQVYGHA